MSTKKQTHRGDKAGSKPSSAKPATEHLPVPAHGKPTWLVSQQAKSDSKSLTSAQVLQLQRTFGNQAVGKFLSGVRSRPVIQAQFTVGPVNDAYEQEADRVAAQVVHAPTSPTPIAQRAGEEDELQAKPLVSIITPLVQRGAAPEDEEVQTKALVQRSGGGFKVGAEFEERLGAARRGGTPLPADTRDFMEQRMGADFSGVKVHTDAQADQLNQAIQAKAFTTGQDVFFRQGAYEPGSEGGQELIAHELTHVVQQRYGRYDHDSGDPRPTWGGNEGSKDVLRRKTEEYVERGEELYYKVTSGRQFKKVKEDEKGRGAWCYAAVEYIYRDMTGKWEGFGKEFEQTQEGIARRYWTSRYDELGGWGMIVDAKDKGQLEGLKDEQLQAKERALKIDRSVRLSFGEATMPGAQEKQNGSMTPVEIMNIINDDGIIFVGDTMHWQVIYGYERNVADEQGAQEFKLYIWDVTGKEKVWDYYNDYQGKENLTHMW